MPARHPNYNTVRWKKLRQVILARDNYQCQMCAKHLTGGQGTRDAAIVDHLEPAKYRPELFFDEANLRAVCKYCHDTQCHRIENRNTDPAQIRALKLAFRPVGHDGYPVDVSTLLTPSVGQPGATDP